jgi:hypothetical protein
MRARDREREVHRPLRRSTSATGECRETDERQALGGVDPDVRPDHLEEARDEVDLDVEVLEGADQVEHLLVRVVREGDDHALDVEDLHHLRELLETAEQRDVREVLRPLLGVAVHEADEVEAIFGMLAELLRDELAHVARADDDRVLTGEMLARSRVRSRGPP